MEAELVYGYMISIKEPVFRLGLDSIPAWLQTVYRPVDKRNEAIRIKDRHCVICKDI